MTDERIAEAMGWHWPTSVHPDDQLAKVRAVVHKAVSEALAENERLRHQLKYQDARNNWVGTHSPGCWSWGPMHYECAVRRIGGSND